MFWLTVIVKRVRKATVITDPASIHPRSPVSQVQSVEDEARSHSPQVILCFYQYTSAGCGRACGRFVSQHGSSQGARQAKNSDLSNKDD